MLAAALVPDTALLLPGAAGRAEVLADVRAAALAAVADLVAAGPRRVVVVATDGPAGLGPPGRCSLGALGIPDPHGTSGPDPLAGPATSVALALLDRAEWRGEVVAVGTDHVVRAGLRARDDRTDRADRADRADPVVATLAALGGELRDDDGVLVAGSLSACRGPDAPRPDDPRAAAFDEAVLADLLDLGPTARERLAAVPVETAHELAVTAWGPWQVLVGAVRTAGPPAGVLRHVSAPFGCTYAVLTWRAA